MKIPVGKSSDGKYSYVHGRVYSLATGARIQRDDACGYWPEEAAFAVVTKGGTFTVSLHATPDGIRWRRRR